MQDRWMNYLFLEPVVEEPMVETSPTEYAQEESISTLNDQFHGGGKGLTCRKASTGDEEEY